VVDEEEDAVLLVEEEVVLVAVLPVEEVAAEEEALGAVDLVVEEAGLVEVGAEVVDEEEDVVAGTKSSTRARVSTFSFIIHYTSRALVFCNIGNYEYHVHIKILLAQTKGDHLGKEHFKVSKACVRKPSKLYCLSDFCVDSLHGKLTRQKSLLSDTNFPTWTLARELTYASSQLGRLPATVIRSRNVYEVLAEGYMYVGRCLWSESVEPMLLWLAVVLPPLRKPLQSQGSLRFFLLPKSWHVIPNSEGSVNGSRDKRFLHCHCRRRVSLLGSSISKPRLPARIR
jgi:hypothetical protein